MRKKLVIQTARFGDLIQSKRLLASLDAPSGLCANENLEEVARFIYPQTEFFPLKIPSPKDVPKDFPNRDLFVKLASGDWEEIYNCNFSPLTSAAARLFARDKIIGYRSDEHAAGGILKSPWARLVFRATARRDAATMNLVDFWGWFTKRPIAGEDVNPPAAKKGGGVGVVCAGREARRSLPPVLIGRFAELASDIYGEAPIKIFGLQSQTKLGRDMERSLSRRAAARVINLTGKTNFKQLKEEIASLDLLLTPDTGTMHLAAALGTPVMAFFLSSAACHETAPYGANHLIWQSAPACAPCVETAACPNSEICLDAFKRPEFLRAMAGALTGATPALPAGLQLWQTSFDELGQNLLLRAGEDPAAGRRRLLRALLKKWLGLEGWRETLANAPEQTLNDLITALFPDEEWMLPRKRYY